MPTKTSDSLTSKPIENGFVTDILKNRVVELDKQLIDKNTVINFLSTQFTSNTCEVSNTKEAFNNCCNWYNSSKIYERTDMTLSNDMDLMKATITNKTIWKY